MNSWACKYCGTRWPREEEYRHCPVCREDTTTSSSQPSVSEADATTVRKRAEFGWWLWDNGRL